MSGIVYTVAPVDPHAHCFEIRCRVAQPDAQGQVFALPAWIRGSYRIRDFAKHVVRIAAFSEGQPLALQRLDKSRLRCAPCDGALELIYTVHAFDSSVRKAWLDAERGFFNGSSLFYAVVGAESQPCELQLQRPDPALCPDWRVATALPALQVDDDGFGRYRAADYDELIDHPVEMGRHQRIAFDVDGIPHALVLSGRCEPDGGRLARDLAAICRTERALFGRTPTPADGFDRYLFLCNVQSNGYGGLEHRASSALVCARDALPRPGDAPLRRGYRSFLGLVSHEYFHLWNVKRITPARFAESDLAAEAYTCDLWAYEGVTSYYDDYLLLRAGCIDAAAYLDLLAQTATRVQRAPGHAVQTLADASFEAWIKYYQPDENTPNAGASYYAKGALVALCLDLTLRADSGVTLDDVMRALWTRYGRAGTPAPEGALEALAAELSGLDLKAFFDAALRDTAPLPMAALLKRFGVKAQLRRRCGVNDEGGRVEGSPTSIDVGLRLRESDGSIAVVFNGSAAERAGLAPGDIPLALDGLRVTAGQWAQRLELLTADQHCTLAYFRGDELRQTVLQATPASADSWTLTLDDGDEAALARRHAWLGV